MGNSLSFPARFIADEYFIRDIVVDTVIAAKVMIKLNNIHKNSKHYPLTHNLIFDECFKNAIVDKKIRGYALLGAFHPEQIPDFVKGEVDFESKLIKYAINIATKRPYNAIILTSKAQYDKYVANSHYTSNPAVRASVKIVYGEEAIKFIEIICGSQD